tara:strand:+ start:359 stop:493 length:135 start_codon:yes stop_codon:yes gene_type:complete
VVPCVICANELAADAEPKALATGEGTANGVALDMALKGFEGPMA